MLVLADQLERGKHGARVRCTQDEGAQRKKFRNVRLELGAQGDGGFLLDDLEQTPSVAREGRLEFYFGARWSTLTTSLLPSRQSSRLFPSQRLSSALSP